MAGYVESTLTKGEQVVYTGKTSIWSLLPLLILGLLTIWLWGLGIIFWILAAIRYMTTELAITNKRIIAKIGLISRRTIELNLQKAESLQVEQSILGRTFNYGSIEVSGTGASKVPVHGISQPLEFRRAFLDAQEQAAQVVQVRDRDLG